MMHFQHSHSIRACIPAKVGVVRTAPKCCGAGAGLLPSYGSGCPWEKPGPGGNGVGSDIGLGVCRVGGGWGHVLCAVGVHFDGTPLSCSLSLALISIFVAAPGVMPIRCDGSGGREGGRVLGAQPKALGALFQNLGSRSSIPMRAESGQRVALSNSVISWGYSGFIPQSTA